MNISLIAAVAENKVIGADGGMPWRLPADLKYFKKTTLGSPIIMGRKTFESFGKKPLPQRTNIVLTRDHTYKGDGIVVVHSLDAALGVAEEKVKIRIKMAGETPALPEDSKTDEVFVIGGEKIFIAALPLADKLYLTKVHTKPEGDTYFPQVDFNNWELVSSESHKKDDRNSCDYTFEVYIKK